MNRVIYYTYESYPFCDEGRIKYFEIIEGRLTYLKEVTFNLYDEEEKEDLFPGCELRSIDDNLK